VSRPTWFIGPWELSAATAHLPASPREGRVLLIESTGKGSALPYHRWKLVLVLSALRHLVAELRAAGYEVDHRVAPSYAGGIEAHIAEFRPSEVLVQEPAEWGVARSIGALADRGLVRLLPDRRFLTSRAEFGEWARGRKLFRMEDFYRWQRKRLGILMDRAGKPAGGQWNLDRENRRSATALAKHGIPSPPAGFTPDEITGKVMRLVGGKPGAGTPHQSAMDFSAHWGSVDGFDLPVTRTQALEALADFLRHRLADFGPYEDAMLRGETYLYHSRLSAAMNVGLLHPEEIVRAALAAAGRSAVPLASIEGFVRQIIGWREYVNGIYWLRMPGYRAENYFGFRRPLPQLYWEPERTDLACLQDSVRMVRDTGYAHHIHRLMVLSNFANLTGVDPLRLSEWFWAGFADAMEWVELPNVVGMATFADGGLLASKPYVSSAAYINRMSNYCGGCRYDPQQRTGPDACPFNYLYWSFLDDIRQGKLDVGQRMALVLKGVERLKPAELRAMRAERERFLASLAPDETGWAFHHDQG
jgi:deoxyribodipyrimidine photolyase-related protein